jgi:hypothetical protein
MSADDVQVVEEEVVQADIEETSSETSLVVTSSDPETVKAAILAAFPPEVAEDLELTPEQIQAIVNVTNGSVKGLSTVIPKLCSADCEFTKICVFHKLGIAPFGNLCPEEKLFIEATAPSLVRSLKIDTDDAVEFDMLREYVDAMVQENRARKLIGIYGELQKKVAVVNQKTGEAFWEDRLNEATQLRKEATTKKDKLRRAFLATREMREKYQTGGKADESQKLSDLRERMEAAEAAQAAAEEAEYTEVDDTKES